VSEPVHQFEKRKRDHITFALKDENEAAGQSGFSHIQLQHEALPDLNFSEITLETLRLGQKVSVPFIVSSMTAGHAASPQLNARLAEACQRRGWWMGVGSQRRELFDQAARDEWQSVRALAPNVKLMGNIGVAQLIETPIDKVKELVEVLSASAMIVHLNALQECLQIEGTPNFRGGLKKITQLAKELNVPVVVKETGCGFSAETLQRLQDTGVRAVDVSGYGGTHWGRIEGERAAETDWQQAAAATFAGWGISTAQALKSAKNKSYEVWASGGVRSGLDAAKALAMGAKTVGFAKPILQAALVSDEALDFRMSTIENELRVALFCTGSASIEALQAKGYVENE